MPRRSSIVFLSVTAHAVTVSALVIASIVAPGVLPLPHDVLAAPFERVVQLPDVPLPRVRQPTTPRPPIIDDAPVLSPDTLPHVDNAPPETSLQVAGVVEGPLGSGSDLVNVGRNETPGDGIGAPTPRLDDTPPIRLHSGIAPPKRIAGSAPEYPAIARQAGIDGVVILELTITAQGDVADARVLRSIAVLDQAALDAVRQWKYQPTRLNGEAVAVLMTVTVNFSLKR